MAIADIATPDSGPSDSALALDVDGVRMTYGKRKNETEALRGVSLQLREGERFALLGPNGAGKTTLISIIATLLDPAAGAVRVFGADVVRDAKAVRAMIGYVPQDIALYPMLAAVDNLKFFGAMQGLGGELLRERMREVLAIVGLEDVAKKKVETYSGGMKRRLNLAVGLLHRPRLLLLDEPTVGVDPQSRNHILESIRRLNEEYRVTILYTTHYMEEAETLCDRVAIIDHGEIIANDRVSTLTGGGRGAAISVTCDDPERLVGALRTATGVTDVLQSESGEVTFTAPTSAEGLSTLVQAAAAHGIEPRDIAVGNVSLEQVFLRLTGRALRD